MRVSKKTVSAAFTGAVAAATVTGLGIGQAHAAGLWHVKNGGVGYHGPFKGTGTLSITDGTKGLTWHCPKAVASGSLPTSNITGSKIGTIGLGSPACSLLGLKFNVHATANIFASTYASGRVHGRLGGLRGTIKGVSNPCQASFSGSEAFSYRNASHRIMIDPGKVEGIKFTKATGCPVGVGDPGALAAGFTITTPGALTISQS